MQTLLNGAGFLGTSAPFHSDLSLILILISAILFTIGWRLAVGKHFEMHRWVQTSAAIVNTLAVLTIMIPSYIIYILPGVPAQVIGGQLWCHHGTRYHRCVGAAPGDLCGAAGQWIDAGGFAFPQL